MNSLAERLFDTVIVLATPLLAAVKKKTKPKRAAARHNRKRAPAKKPARRTAVKRPARAAVAKRGARAKKTAGRAGARSGGRAGTGTATGTRAPAAPPARPAPPRPKPVPPTGRAILLAPENGKFADSLRPKFRWLSVGGATRYEVAWSDEDDFSDSQTIVSIATEAAVPDEEPLSIGTNYYWRVRGGNESGWGPWSPASSFQVLEEPPTA